MPNKFFTKLRVVLPLAVSLLILYLLFWKVDTEKTIESLQDCDLRLAGLAVLFSLSVNIFLGAEKWRKILAALGCVLPYREVLSIRTGCIPFKVLLPFKSSELLKAVYLDRRKKLAFSRAVGSLILDKVLNIMIIIPVAVIGLTFVDIPVPRILLLSVLLLILLVVYSHRFRQGLIGMVTQIHPRLTGMFSGFLSGFAEVRTGQKTVLILYSLVYQSSEFVNAYLLLKAVGVTVPFFYLMVMIPVIMVVNNLPITVLGLGTREIAVVFFFSRFGPSASLLSGAILISLIEHVLPVVVGLLFVHSFHTYFAMKDDIRLVEVGGK